MKSFALRLEGLHSSFPELFARRMTDGTLQWVVLGPSQSTTCWASLSSAGQAYERSETLQRTVEDSPHCKLSIVEV